VIGYLTHNYALIQAFRTRPPSHEGRSRREAAVSGRVFKMAPKLSDFFADTDVLAVRGPLDRPISGLAMDSRRVVPGQVFFALSGQRADGTHFVDEAVNRGAVAVITTKIPTTIPAKVTFVQVADPRVALAQVAASITNSPIATWR